MATGLSAHAMDTFVGTNVSTFTDAEIPDMSGCDPQSSYWLSNYILNSMMRAKPASPEFEYRFNFFRRVITAFDEYDLARGQTLDFLTSRSAALGSAGPGPGFGAYFKALHHWEQFLMSTWQALSTMGSMVPDFKIFEKGDGSVSERLNSLYNSAKHAESRIKNGQMPAQGTLPVWPTNEGLRNTEHALSFEELADLLRELATWAFVLEDPLTTRERLDALIELESAAEG